MESYKFVLLDYLKRIPDHKQFHDMFQQAQLVLKETLLNIPYAEYSFEEHVKY